MALESCSQAIVRLSPNRAWPWPRVPRPNTPPAAISPENLTDVGPGAISSRSKTLPSRSELCFYGVNGVMHPECHCFGGQAINTETHPLMNKLTSRTFSLLNCSNINIYIIQTFINNERYTRILVKKQFLWDTLYKS